jgi:ATP-dependent Clp protease ATP-binding subunit ClpA
MFERFTDRARRVVVRAQEEARGLRHHYIGTEHILLALADERDGMAAHVLGRFDMRPDGIREEIMAMVGTGEKAAPKGHIPFTPRAKKTMELALREALDLHHDYIGTEHMLLGVLREGDGVGAQILKAHSADLERVRVAVLDLLQEAGAGRAGRRLRRLIGTGKTAEPAFEQAETPATPAAKDSLAEAGRLAGEQPVGSHHLIAAALSDPNAVAAQVLSGLGIDLDQVREALRGADVTGTSDELPEEAGRRQMTIRVDQDKLTIEASDEEIIKLGQAAVTALGDQAADPPGTIRGSLPASASLSELWLVLRSSLRDIRLHAEPAEGAKGKPADPGGEAVSA